MSNEWIVKEEFYVNLVNIISHDLTSNHRGVMQLPWGECVIYGNDGFGSPRTKKEIALVKQYLAKLPVGGKHGSFKEFTSDDAYSWILVTNNLDVGQAHRALWRAWEKCYEEVTSRMERVSIRFAQEKDVFIWSDQPFTLWYESNVKKLGLVQGALS